MTEPPPHHQAQSYGTPPVDLYLAARQQQQNQQMQLQNPEYPQQQSVVDSYLQGNIPFEDYWDHLHQQQPIPAQRQGLDSYGTTFSQQQQGSSAYNTLANIVEEIELNTSGDSSSLEAEEIDFSALFPADQSGNHPLPRTSASLNLGAGSSGGPGGGRGGRGRGSRGGRRGRGAKQSRGVDSGSVGVDEESSLREELLSSETQNLLVRYSHSLGYDYQQQDDSEILVEDDEVRAIFSTTEDEEIETDDPMDDEYVPSTSSGFGRGQKKKNRSKGRRGRPPGSGKGKGGARRVIEDEESIFGVPEEWRESDINKSKQSDTVRPLRKLPDHLQALVGQANLCYAQGRRTEALEMMEEVLRQKPKNPEPYQCLASIFEDMKEKEKQLQCGLLAAYLDYLTPANLWVNLAHLAEEVNKPEQAIACLSKAIRMQPQEWSNYAMKLGLLDKQGDSKRILETKVQAVKGMKETSDFEWYSRFTRETADIAFSSKDVAEGIVCYRHLLEKGRQLGIVDFELLEKHVQTLITAKHYTDAAKSIFEFSSMEALDSNCQQAVRQNWGGGAMDTIPLGFPPLEVASYNIPTDFPKKLKIFLVICWIELGRQDLAQPMIAHLDQCGPISEEYLEIAQVMAKKGLLDKAEGILVKMLQGDHRLANLANVWLVYAEVLSAQNKIDAACEAYNRVVQLAPDHVEARVSLAALQQDLGQAERALETLKKRVTPERFDIEDVEFKDERLLHKECLILYSQQKWESFLKCAYRILAPYFYDMYSVQEKRAAARSLYRDKYGLKRISMHVRRVTLEVSRETLLERLVKKIGKGLSATSASKQKNFKLIPMNDLNELCFKVCEVLFDQERFEELTQVAGFSANMPALVVGGLSRTFEQIMLLGAVQSKNAKVAFALLHNSVSDVDRPRLWNLYGLVFVLSQDVSYHRIILRAAAKSPDTAALTILSGNNSLISGTYQHALSEYLVVLADFPGDPLVNLLTGLTCLHLACKKDIARRHDICLQGFAFLSQYEQLRGPCQETYYNMGRAMQQANVLFAAIHYYRKVIESEVITATPDEEEDKKRVYDLKPLAAHNLALIYQNSGNAMLARDILEKYCTV